MARNPESTRLEEARTANATWKKWGPYLSERQWGTVREDYSQDGNAWNYFTHDQARSRAYHWGEDGLAGISDDQQLLCFGIALWNGEDPILKERLFGLTNLAPAAIDDPFKSFSATLQTRHAEADEFYKSITPERVSPDEALVMRQALAGMLWSKQFFFFDVDKWLEEHGV